MESMLIEIENKLVQELFRTHTDSNDHQGYVHLIPTEVKVLLDLVKVARGKIHG